MLELGGTVIVPEGKASGGFRIHRQPDHGKPTAPEGKSGLKKIKDA